MDWLSKLVQLDADKTREIKMSGDAEEDEWREVKTKKTFQYMRLR